MKSKPLPFKPILFILLSTLFISSSLAQVPIKLQFENELQLLSNAPLYFHLASLALDPTAYLSLSALTSKNCTPSVFISKTNQNPNSKDNADYYFGGEPGKAILFIPAKELIGTAPYIGLSTNQDCIVDFTVEEATNYEFLADIDSDYFVYEIRPADLNDKTSAVFTMDIPFIPEGDRIIIHVNAYNLDDRYLPYIDFFVKKGTVAPDSRNFDPVVQHAWLEGLTTHIYNDNPAFCVNCKITASLKFEKNAYLQIHVGVLHSSLVLRPFPIIDGLEKGKENTYIAQFNEGVKDQNLRININPIHGNFSAYINCDSRPESVNDFKWHFIIDSFEQILLTQREHKYCNTTTYYIVLSNADDNSFFSINAQPRLSSQLFLEKDVLNLGEIEPNETVIYDLFVPIYAGEKIVLTLESPHDIEINIRNCRFSSDCPDLLPPVQNIWDAVHEVLGTVWPDEFKYDVQTTDNKKVVTLNPHTNGCVPFLIRDGYNSKTPLPVCAYKIELTSKNQDTVQYKFIADIEGHTLILPGVPVEGAVLVNDQMFYIVYAPYDDLKSVSFQLTTLSGDVALYVSNTTKFPTEADDLTQFAHEGFILFTNTTNLNGTYYITVKGLQTSSFLLNANLITKDGRQEDFAVRLHESIPQKGVLLPKHEHPMLFYSMNIFFDDNWVGSIKISINPTHGNLVMTVNNNGQIPQPNFNQWQTNNYELTIPSSDPKFNRRAIYYIGIYPDADDSTTLTYDEISFTVVYSIESVTKGEDINLELEHLTPVTSKHVVLTSDSTFEGKISKGEIRFFSFTAYGTDDTITASLQSSYDTVAMFISTDENNKYPSPNSFSFTTKDTFKNSITITNADLAKTCPPKPNEVAICPIYLSVLTTIGDELPFTLDIRRNIKPQDTNRTSFVQLNIGRERIFQVPEADQFIYFYFYTRSGHESFLTIRGRHYDIEIYGKIAILPLGENINTYFGSPESVDYPEVSGMNARTMGNYNNIRLPPLESTDPVVALCKVKFRPHADDAFDFSSKPTFSVIPSNEVTQITPGTPFNGESFEDDIYQYYSFEVPSPDEKIKVTLTSLSNGNQDLYLSHWRFARPTADRHHFYSASSPRVEELTVTREDIYPRPSMIGTWVIGVYSVTKGEYSLLVTLGNQIVKLVELNPIEQYLTEKRTAYFSYYHDQEKDLYVKLDRMSGSPTVYINSLKEGTNVQDNLPSKEKNTWVFTPKEQSTKIIKVGDTGYCTHCLYVIAVEAEEASKFSLVILEEGHWELAQNEITYQDSLLAKATKGYFFITTNQAGASLNIKALNGELNVYTSHSPVSNTSSYMDKILITTTDPYKQIIMTPNDLNSHPEQKEVWDGNSLVQSDPYGYYVILENPNDQPVKYTILFRDQKSSQIILSPDVRQHLNVDGKSEQNVIFYSSSYSSTIRISIEYSVPADERGPDDNDLKFSASYWSERMKTDRGNSITDFKSDVSTDKISDGLKYMRKNIEIKSQVGKYQFNIENPGTSPISFSILVYTTKDSGYISLEENSYHFSRLNENHAETFEVYLPGPGSWYFELNQCSGKFRVAIADSIGQLKDSKSQFIPDNDAFLYKYKVQDAGMKYIKVLADKADDPEDGAAFLLRNMYFKDDSLIDFDKATAGKVKNSQFNAQNNSLPVNFEPVNFGSSSKGDFVLYKIVACEDEGLARTIALCEMRPLGQATGENCQFDEFSQKLDQPAPAQTELDLKPGNYHLYIVGNIIHKGEAVHSVSYAPSRVNVDRESQVLVQAKTYLPYIGAGVGVGVMLVLAIWAFRRAQKKKEVKKQTELENFRKRGYGIMQEEF